MVVPHIPKGKDELVWKLMKTLSPLMSTHNNDGLGYSAMKPDGSLFGERWFNNEQAWKYRQENTVDTKLVAIRNKMLAKFGERIFLPEPPKLYNKFGTFAKNDSITAAFLHTRAATCNKSLENVHPFYRVKHTKNNETYNDDIALIHNGMIRNEEEWKDQKVTTNDSEAILCAYLNNFVQYAPEEMTTMLDELVGYYAFSVMTKDKNDVPIVDIVRGDKADLCVAYIEELETEVFCTRPELIHEACKKLKWSIQALSEVKTGSYFRINALTGDFLHNETFKPGYEWVSQKSYYAHGEWVDLNKDKRELKIVEDATKKKTTVTALSNQSAFRSGLMHDEVAKIIAQVNGTGKTEAEKDQLEMEAIEFMSDTEFQEYCDARDRMKSEDFVSDDPEVVSQWLKSQQH
jgi:glucosamine 6-phosphate synthetase-like amidotransferase/phosphosugar isomerase protein